MKLLLTSAGFKNKNIGEKFLNLLNKPVKNTRVLFIPAAAINDEAKYYVGVCKKELVEYGIDEANIFSYNFEYVMTEDEALKYDVIYFTGGSTLYLLECIKKNSFNSVIDKIIIENKIYVGVSAGSIIMTPNISLDNPLNPSTTGLGYIQAFLAVHCNERDENRFTEIEKKLPLPFIALNDMQAVILNNDGYSIIE